MRSVAVIEYRFRSSALYTPRGLPATEGYLLRWKARE